MAHDKNLQLFHYLSGR